MSVLCLAKRTIVGNCTNNSKLVHYMISIKHLSKLCTKAVNDHGVYHDCRLKYDQHRPISIIVHNAHKRAVLILKSFHSRDPHMLKRAY